MKRENSEINTTKESTELDKSGQLIAELQEEKQQFEELCNELLPIISDCSRQKMREIHMALTRNGNTNTGKINVASLKNVLRVRLSLYLHYS